VSISLILNNNPTYSLFSKFSPVKQSSSISWSTWDDKKSDDEDSDRPPIITHDENSLQELLPTKQTYNWHSLVTSAVQTRQIDNQTKTSETMPKFNFDDNSFDTLFDNLDE